MTQFNCDSITTLKQGIQVIEDTYISKVQKYLNNGGKLDYGNNNFTKS